MQEQTKAYLLSIILHEGLKSSIIIKVFIYMSNRASFRIFNDSSSLIFKVKTSPDSSSQWLEGK